MSDKRPKYDFKNSYYIADLHFFDKECILSCSRGFKSVDEMNQYMIYKWNSVIKDDDTVYVLGDFCCSNDFDDDQMEYICRQLKGKKILVMGNHDERSMKIYENLFEKVYDVPIILNQFFILSHEPNGFLPENYCYMNVYGHIHNDCRFKDYSRNSFCVSAERLNYTPIKGSDILKKCSEEL